MVLQPIEDREQLKNIRGHRSIAPNNSRLEEVADGGQATGEQPLSCLFFFISSNSGKKTAKLEFLSTFSAFLPDPSGFWSRSASPQSLIAVPLEDQRLGMRQHETLQSRSYRKSFGANTGIQYEMSLVEPANCTRPQRNTIL